MTWSNPKIGYGFGTAYALFALVCMSRMSGDPIGLLDPVGMLFALWVLSPIALVTWLQAKSKLWWFALLPSGALGVLAFYDMAFRSSSSTAALGLIFVPFYQWVLVGIGGIVVLLAGKNELD